MKKIIKLLRNHFWKKWLRQHKCKMAGGVSSLGAKTTLILEEHVALGNVVINAKQLSIGAHTYIRSDCVLSAVSSIGRFCSIGSNCYIGQDKNTHPSDWVSSHPFQFTKTSLTFEPEIVDVTIGDDVWIGHDAMIMEGVTVGTGAIIATRAVVLHDVPPYAIVAGFPAKVIKYRHPPELASQLLSSKWWECNVDFLLTQRLDEPEAALPQLMDARADNLANYKQLEVSRKGCRVLPN
ncbi:CatB-related O-acetyltransferase [Pseudomonas fluorescens]|jgi:chloramphenicol O-acetyltransferase type B|uniref:CatB-related O-acetyltransferase n=1 Tax=Pseudomonas TaxID=286 RepID=UPI001A91A6E2|nr:MULTISPECIES: CatB-related O-acetyltransferase [Pseudomonas]MDZ5433318.1 CatB-related O-acetyltransferase [Pseudomonas fluorescens]